MEIKGLSEEHIREISKIKEEDPWVLDFRLKSYESFKNQEMPNFGPKFDLDFEKVIYYKTKENEIDKLIEEPCQVGKYFMLSYSKMIEILLEAENKGYIQLYNNFGHRFVEISDIDYDELISRLYENR